jgi:hypothetical protein
MLGDEEQAGNYARYLLQQPESGRSDALIIAYAATRPGTRERYSYVAALSDLPCPVMFVRIRSGYFLGFGGNTEIEDEVALAQEQVRSEFGVDKRNVIACGGSAGAIRALWHACDSGYGHAVLGAPLVKAGDFLQEESVARARERIVPTIAPSGGTAEDTRDWLNTIVSEKLNNPAAETTLHVFISERDELYPYSLPWIEDACRTNPKLELDLTLASYDGHREHRKLFRPYLRAKALEVVSSIDESAVESDASASR